MTRVLKRLFKTGLSSKHLMNTEMSVALLCCEKESEGKQRLKLSTNTQNGDKIFLYFFFSFDGGEAVLFTSCFFVITCVWE